MRHTLLSGGLAAALFLLASAFSPAAAREKGEYPIAGIWQMEPQAVLDTCAANARRVFGGREK